jgi:DNA-binding response OmpR family regulator
MAQTILVIEDEKDLRDLLAKGMTKEGFRAVTAADGESGLALAERERPDAVILDLMLPRMSGEDVCRELRKTSRVPIVVLTAKSDEMDKVVMLELGADDYMTKPFSQRELVARLRAVLRRSATPAPAVAGPIRIGTIELDLIRHELRLGGKPVAVTPREFGLFQYLAESKGRAISREELLERVWGARQAADLDTRTVDQHVARLREKLGSEARRLVTVKGAGYRLDAPA